MTKYLCLTIISIALFVGACDTSPAQNRYGFNVSGLTFEVFDDTEGIHPSQVVLVNERNPFRNVSIDLEASFDILANGGNAGAFYAWATLLARTPTGERQFFAAQQLANIYEAEEVDEEDLETVRLMAIAGFQAVLDDFPSDVTFDATGNIPFELATPAYLGIDDLGGRVEGGWILVDSPTGPKAVKQSGEGSN